MHIVLTLVGLALQLFGAVVTAWGAHLVWREAATGSEHLLDPLTDAARRFWRRSADPILRWIGRPRSRTVRLSGNNSAVGVASARVSKSYSPLPTDLAVGDAIAELDRRTQALIADIGRVESRLLDELETQDRRHDGLARRFDQYVDKQDEHVRQRSLRGIRFEAAGLAFVTLGAIAQALGSVLAPTTDPTDH